MEAKDHDKGHKLYIGTEEPPDKRLVIVVSDADYERSPHHHGGRHGPDVVEVTDLLTGKRVKIRSADCGAGCRCALALVE
jgi:hypothetical protein